MDKHNVIGTVRYGGTRHPSTWLMLVLLLAALTAVRAQVLDEIDAEATDQGVVAHLQLTVPLQYLSHEPTGQGDELHIQLRTVANIDLSEPDLQGPDILGWRQDARLPIVDVRYQAVSSDRAVITVRFSREVSFQVRSSPDYRSLLVTVLPEAGSAVPATPAPRSPTSRAAQASVPGRYTINLESSMDPVEPPDLGKVGGIWNHVIYTTTFPIQGREWHRLRVGFFATKKAARQVLDQVRQQYPRAWIAVADDAEIRKALANPLVVQQQRPRRPGEERRQRPRKVEPIEPSRPPVPVEKIEALLEQARQSMASGDYAHAIQLYNKILQYPDHPYLPDALELLGLARERNGQLAHAKAEYRRYLALYPEGEGAQRVQQRLDGLLTARKAPKARLRESRRAKREKPWEVFGGFSQFFRRDANITDTAGETVSQSSLSTDLDITARRRGQVYDIRTRFTGSYLYDFLSNGPGNETRVSSLYLDLSSNDRDLSMRLGRQSRNRGGVLGRFDGGLVSYQATSWAKLNLVAGLPVNSTSDGIDSDRFFVGVSSDIGTFLNAWDFDVFYVEQHASAFVDRRSVGGEARYFDPAMSLLSFVDYDIYYRKLNTFVFLGTWRLPNRDLINASVDYRNSPFLTTSNALIGQTVGSLDELKQSFTDGEIEQLALDRTARSRTATLGYTHQFSERYQLNADVTMSNLAGTPASGGVAEIPGTGNEFFYTVQMTGSSLFRPGDTTLVSVRYSDLNASDIISLNLNSRFPLTPEWRINPRLRLDHRNNHNDNSTQWSFFPSLRMDYRWHRRYRFEVEAGGELTTRKLTTTTDNTQAYFVNLGYRIDF